MSPATVAGNGRVKTTTVVQVKATLTRLAVAGQGRLSAAADSRCSPNSTTAATIPTASAAPVARLTTLAASSASPTPPTMLLSAATTLAP
jgi:hypothetical protein